MRSFFRWGFPALVALAIGAAVSCGGGEETKPTSAPEAPKAAPTTPPPTPTPFIAPTTAPAPTAAPVPTATATAAPKAPAGPAGKLTVALSSIGPANYELYQLVWPWNDRNQFMGMYDTIFYDDRREAATSLLNPSIAKGWQFTDQGLDLTIRDDIPWHDAKYGKLTVEDVLFSFERAAKDGTKWTRSEALTTNFKLAEIKQTGPNQITMPWNKRDLRWRSVPRDLTIQSKKMFVEVGEEKMNITPMGTGAYKGLEHKTGDILKLEAVEKHWRETASVKFIDVLETPEETVRLAMLKAGQADIIQMGVPSIPAVKVIQGVKMWVGPTTGLEGAQIVPSGQYYQEKKEDGSPTNRTPLTNLPWVGKTPEQGLKVRQAMAMAIDRQALIDSVLGGLGAKHYLWNLGPGHPRWNADLEKKFGIQYDQAKAKQLLSEAGYGNGFEFNFFIPSGLNSTLEQLCQAMIPMWSSIGVKASVDRSAYSAVRPKMLARTIDVVWCWQESGWSVDPDVLYRFSTRAVWNPGIEYVEPLDFESRILSQANSEESWKIITNEWLPWFQTKLPTFQTVAFTAPIAAGPRVKDWPMRVHSNRWPYDPQLIKLAGN